jgi:hypothetical protein
VGDGDGTVVGDAVGRPIRLIASRVLCACAKVVAEYLAHTACVTPLKPRCFAQHITGDASHVLASHADRNLSHGADGRSAG